MNPTPESPKLSQQSFAEALAAKTEMDFVIFSRYNPDEPWERLGSYDDIADAQEAMKRKIVVWSGSCDFRIALRQTTYSVVSPEIQLEDR